MCQSVSGLLQRSRVRSSKLLQHQIAGMLAQHCGRCLLSRPASGAILLQRRGYTSQQSGHQRPHRGSTATAATGLLSSLQNLIGQASS